MSKNDYPFRSWDDYYVAFKEKLSSEYFFEEYPQYALKSEESDDIPIDIQIIVSLLERGLNPQYGLDRFIQTLIEGYRFALYMTEEIDVILKIFLKNGAIPNIDEIFNIMKPALLIENDFDNLEEMVQTYPVRGMLIDMLSIIMSINMVKYYEICSIQPCSWENIDRYGKYDLRTACLMVFKDSSRYLQTNCYY
jgi:hypothetical protein